MLAFCVTWVMGVGGVGRLGCVTKPMITFARVCVVYLRERERPGIEGAQVSQTAPRKYKKRARKKGERKRDFMRVSSLTP